MITCPRCCRTSYHPDDERTRYCGACHTWHEYMIPYLHQNGEGSCCGLLALLNALRYFGQTTPAPGEPEYEALIDRARCRHGSMLDVHGVAEHLGLRLEPVAFAAVITSAWGRTMAVPIALRVINPEQGGMHMHGVLVVDVGIAEAALVNYRWRSGPVIERVRLDAIELPVLHNREAWRVRLR